MRDLTTRKLISAVSRKIRLVKYYLSNSEIKIHDDSSYSRPVLELSTKYSKIQF
jgi:hypothetical protein